MADTHTAYTDTDTLIRVLDAADAMPGAAQLRARTYELLRLAPGATVVDVGCGTGRAVAELTTAGVSHHDDVTEAEFVEHRRHPASLVGHVE